MQFTSIPFFIFLFIVVVIYYVLPQKYRNYLLLISSYYFYFSVQPEYLVLLILSTLVNYLVGRGLELKKECKAMLSLGLIFNLGFLFFFKYFNFFGEQINLIFASFRLNLTVPQHSLILPIGISFYTFMALGYILDVYWGDIKAQRNYLTFSIYLAFFPQILSGPIGRAKNLFKQFNEEHPLLYDNFSNGFRLILWGMFKKMVVADNIGVYVNAVFNNIPMHSTLTLIVTALLYPLQLYADFSGYTDIARGVGKLFGFDLAINFRTPYVNSTSITDYWKRNHISLTTWLKDYVFYPFMGFSTSKVKMYFGIFIMFLASGIWHGVGWMFIIWGVLQAILLIIEDITNWDKKGKNKGFVTLNKNVMTYLLIAFTLLFFRIPTISMFRDFVVVMQNNTWNFYSGGSSTIAFLASSVVLLVIFEKLLDKKQFDQWIAVKHWLNRWSLYLLLSITILLIGVLDGNAFIYFQF